MRVKAPCDPVVLRQISYPLRPLPPWSVDAIHASVTLRCPGVAVSCCGALGAIVSGSVWPMLSLTVPIRRWR